MKLYDLKKQMKNAPDNIKLILDGNIKDDLIIYNDNKPSINYLNLKDIRFEIIGDDYYYIVNMLQINKFLRAKKINFQIDFEINKIDISEILNRKEYKKAMKKILDDYNYIFKYTLEKKEYNEILNQIYDDYHNQSIEYLINKLKENNVNYYAIVTSSIISIFKNFLPGFVNKVSFWGIKPQKIDQQIFFYYKNLYDELKFYKTWSIEDFDNMNQFNIDRINNLIDNCKNQIILYLEEDNKYKISPAPAPVVNEIKEVKLLLPPPAPINENNEVIEEKETIKLLPPPEQKSEFIQASEILDYSKILEKFEKLTKNKTCDFCNEQAKFVTYWEGRTKVYLCEKCTINIYEINKEEMFV